jgi:hypothetical protein
MTYSRMTSFLRTFPLHRLIPFAAAGLCLALSLSAGWLWHTLSATTFEAHARLAPGAGLPADPVQDDREPGAVAIEDELFAPDVLSAAVVLLHDRGVALAMATPFDSETDYLFERLHARHVDEDASEVELSCTSADGDEALQMLTALVDALTAAAKNSQASAADGPAAARETERSELAAAIVKHDRAIAEQVEQLEKARAATAVERAADGPTALENQLAEARRAVGDAAARLDGARRDFERNVPAEVVAARLPESPLRTKIIDRLSVERLRGDLRQHEALLAKSSSVYGRNHPRMVEICEKTEQLRRQVAAFPGAPPDVSDGTGKSAPEELVIGELEAELLSTQSRENDIAARLSARSGRLDEQQKLETQLGEARQELAFLHGEHDRIRREINSARSEETARLPAIIEPPALSPDPIAPGAGLQIAVSCVAGMALYLLLLWQLRSRHEHAPVVARVPRESPKTPVPERSRRRFRSEEEQRLARLKMLSGAPRAAVS